MRDTVWNPMSRNRSEQIAGILTLSRPCVPAYSFPMAAEYQETVRPALISILHGKKTSCITENCKLVDQAFNLNRVMGIYRTKSLQERHSFSILLAELPDNIHAFQASVGSRCLRAQDTGIATAVE